MGAAAFDDGGDAVFLFDLVDLVAVVVVVVPVECLDFDDDVEDDKCLDFVSFITGSVLSCSSCVLIMGEMLCFSIDEDDFEFADLFDFDFFAVVVASPLVVLSYKDSLPPFPNVLDMAARSKFTL